MCKLTTQHCNSVLDIFKNGLSIGLWSVPTSRDMHGLICHNVELCSLGPRYFSLSRTTRREQSNMLLVQLNGRNYLPYVQCLRLNAQRIFPRIFHTFLYLPLLPVCQSFLFFLLKCNTMKHWPYLFLFYEKYSHGNARIKRLGYLIEQK